MAPEILHAGRNVAFDPDAALGAGAIAGPGRDARAASSGGLGLTPVALSWAGLTFDVPARKKTKGAGAAAGAAGAAGAAAEGGGGMSSSTSSSNSSTSTSTSTGTGTGAGDAWVPPVMNKIPGGDGARTRVLHHCAGDVKPGEMLAILGSSGAGKSTLLDLLAGRITSSKDCVSGGTVRVNGRKRDFSSYKKLAAYVQQDDTMFATLTVEEQIRFAALLRLPKSMDNARKLDRVEAVIQELGLSKCRDTVIGNELVKGVSGGERKRCSIGVELVTAPSLILADEPTTGLDSFAALNIVTTLRQLASRGRTVVATVHQPRSSIFALFDKLLVLSEGRTMYFGPAADAAPYFSSLGFTSPPHFNVADYVIDAVSIDYRSKELETKSKQRVLYLAGQHEARQDHSLAAMETPAALDDDDAGGKERGGRGGKRAKSFPNSWPAEFAILLQRALLKLSREKVSNTTRLVQTLVFGILLGIIWLRVGTDEDLIAGRSIQGVLFFLGVNMAFDGAFSVIFDFPVERAVLTRERAAGSYRVSAYWLAGFCVDVCKTLILNVLFVTLVYWMVGLRSSVTAYLFAIMVTITMSLTGEGVAQFVSVLTGDAQISAAVVPLIMVVNFLFAGFFILPDAMPGWLRWFRFCTFMYWGYNALGHNEFDFADPALEYVKVILADFNSFSRWENIGFLLLMAFGTKSLYFLVLSTRKPRFDKTL